jgi:agmatine deiminase
MPAEWERHEATWIAWPRELTDWPGKFAPVPWVYTEFVRHVARVEKVRILVPDAAAERRARRILAGQDNVEFFHIPTDRSWTRDFCPIFVLDSAGAIAMTDWRFNGWAKYPNHTLDDAVPQLLEPLLGLPRIQPVWRGERVVLEGGAIDGNGRGALLTTEECLLSPVQARNPGLSRQDLEAVFREYLGIRKVLWLNRGIDGDDTHGHVDDLARFVDDRTVVTVVEENRGDPNYEPLQENLERLRGMTDQDGAPLRVETLPMPEPVYFRGQRLPASYANFYIANGVVLVPTFNDPHDRIALNTLARLFPRHTVAGIHSVDLVLGLGTLHCMTQQQPSGQ